MTRVLAAMLLGVTLCLVATAQDKPAPAADDPVMAKLAKAKEAYQASVQAAEDKLVAAFAVEDKKAEKDTRLTVDQYSKLSKQLEQEKQAFLADPKKLPQAPVMKMAVNDYLAATAAAKKRCLAAFDVAVAAYRGKDKAALQAVLAEREQFFLPSGPRQVAEVVLYYSPQRSEHFSTVTAEDLQTAKDAQYDSVRSQGYILSKQEPGTVPLDLYYHAGRGEYASVATANLSKWLKSDGYKFVRTQGYVFTKEVKWSVPALMYYHEGRRDYWLVVSGSDKRVAEQHGYKNVGAQGFILTEKDKD